MADGRRGSIVLAIARVRMRTARAYAMKQDGEGRAASLHRAAAVLGVGRTDWVEDHRRVRAGEKPADGDGYATVAFRRALRDAGLARDEVDGLIVGPTTSYERMGEILGLDVRWGGQADAVGAVQQACLAIATGMADVVALVYGNDQRSAAVQYGGPSAMGGETFLAYVYHAPWGLTSQGALYALLWRRYMALTGLTERDLGAVAVAQRRWSSLNPHALMRETIDIEAYLAATYIAEPLRLYDYCLVNDGGVALVLCSADRAASLARRAQGRPIFVDGLGRSDLNADATSLGPRLRDFYRPAQRAAAEQVANMAGTGPGDIDVLLVYDSFSCHVPLAVEGFGFCREGDFGRFALEDGIGPGGRLPINTGGGHLSESYMQGWNHQVEAIEQLRGTAGGRQVPGCRHVQYVSDVGGKAASVIYAL